MSKWNKQTYRLKPNHSWTAKPGHKILVLDRGAVHFEYPESWVVLPGKDSIELHDGTPPDDNCRLQVSLMRLPPGVDWRGLPLKQLLEAAVEGDEREVISRGVTVEATRPGLELAWTEVRFVDPTEQRAAASRCCLARGSGIQALITMDYWLDDAERFSPVWDEVLESLRLGEYVADPTTGRRR